MLGRSRSATTTHNTTTHNPITHNTKADRGRFA
jgi:hypothetical protein